LWNSLVKKFCCLSKGGIAACFSKNASGQVTVWPVSARWVIGDYKENIFVEQRFKNSISSKIETLRVVGCWQPFYYHLGISQGIL